MVLCQWGVLQDNLVLSLFINWVENVNWPQLRGSEVDVPSVSLHQSEGLILETSAETFESLYSGQFTLTTQLIKPNYG